MKIFKLTMAIVGLIFGSVIVQIPTTIAVFFKVSPDWLRFPILLGTALIIGGILLFLRRDLKSQIPEKESGKFSIIKIVLMTACVFAAQIAINSILVYIFHLDLGGSREAIEGVLFSDKFLLTFISVVFIGPGLEEILFRGLFQEYLLQRFPKQAVLSVLLTSFLFGFAHTYHFLHPQTYLLMLSGLFFGYIYWKNRDVKSAILAHAFYNFLVTFLTLLWR